MSNVPSSLDRLLSDELARWPVGSAAVAVVDKSGVVGRAGDAATFPLASVTKLLTALTVLQAVEERVLDLDEAVGPPGATLRHLLAHASGLACDSDKVMAAPGQRRIYSNRGIELAAELLEQRTARQFSTLVEERVLRPLGMVGTRLEGSPAHGAMGNITDLGLLAQELLSPRWFSPTLVALATAPVFAAISGVLPGFGRQEPNDWGLGFEIRGHKAPHWMSPQNAPSAFGHFGQSGAFLWVDPCAELACVAAGDTAFGPWAAQAWPRLATRVLEELRPTLRC